jgi:hypothetical protein
VKLSIPQSPKASSEPIKSNFTIGSGKKLSFIIQRFKYLVGEPSLPVEEVLDHFQDIIKSYKANPIAYARHTPKLLASLVQLNATHGESSLAFARASMNIYRFLGIVVPGGVNQLGTLDSPVAQQAFQVLARLAAESDYDGCAEVLSLISTIPSLVSTTDTETCINLRKSQLETVCQFIHSHYMHSANVSLQGLNAAANILLCNHPVVMMHFLSSSVGGMQLLSTLEQFYFENSSAESHAQMMRKELAEVMFGVLSIVSNFANERENELAITVFSANIQHVLNTLSVLTPQESLSIAPSVLNALDSLLRSSRLECRKVVSSHEAVVPWIMQVIDRSGTLSELDVPTAHKQQLIMERDANIRIACQVLQRLISPRSKSSTDPTSDESQVLLVQKSALLTNNACEFVMRLLMQELSSSTPSIVVLTSVFQLLEALISKPISNPQFVTFCERFAEKQGPSLMVALLALIDIDLTHVTSSMLSVISTLLSPPLAAEDNGGDALISAAALRTTWVDEGLTEECCRLLHHALHVPKGAVLVAPLLQVMSQLLSNDNNIANVGASSSAAAASERELESIRQRMSDAGFAPILLLLAQSHFHPSSSNNNHMLAFFSLVHYFVKGETVFAADRRRLLFTQHNFPVAFLLPLILQYAKMDHSDKPVVESWDLLTRSLHLFVMPVPGYDDGLGRATIAEIVDGLVKAEPNLRNILLEGQQRAEKSNRKEMVDRLEDILKSLAMAEVNH